MEEIGTLTESGFGQRDQFVRVLAVVRNNTDRVGQTVAVNFNLFDEAGALLKSESQVNSFSRPRTDHVVNTLAELQPGEKVAKLEATLLVQDEQTFTDEPFPELVLGDPEFRDVTLGPVVAVEVSNPTATPLSSVTEVVALCRDGEGHIVGGGDEFPALIPASGRIKVEVPVVVSTAPASCTAHAVGSGFWDGVATPTPSSTTDAVSGSPEAAFKAWVEMINLHDWAGQYRSLNSAQQGIITEAQYVACRTKNPIPATEWVKVLRTTDGGTDRIPGTSTSLPSQVIKVQLEMGGVRVPVDAHMYNEGGIWKWAMTQENLDGCSG